MKRRTRPKFEIRDPTRDPTSEIQHPRSNIRNPTSDIRQPWSNRPCATVLTKLNRYVKRPFHPLVSAVANISTSARYFTTYDAKQGYWQIPLHETSHILTTFTTPWGRYKLLRSPMGLVLTGVNTASKQTPFWDEYQYKLQGKRYFRWSRKCHHRLLNTLTDNFFISNICTRIIAFYYFFSTNDFHFNLDCFSNETKVRKRHRLFYHDITRTR